MLIHHFLERSAERDPGKVALISGDLRVTYAALNAAADGVARWLLRRGLEPGDRVALLLENGFEYVAGYYGILKAGGVAAPLSGELRPEGLARLLARLEGRALLTSARHERLAQAAVREMGAEEAAAGRF